MSIRHLVLAMAGLGKRLRPLTLRRPKSLVPLAGEPILRYVLEETRKTGINDVTWVISKEHERQFSAYLKKAQKLFPELTFHIVVQGKPLGDGHAVLQAAPIVKNAPFAVRFPDDLLFSDRPLLSNLLSLYEDKRGSVILLRRVPKESVSSYGVVDTDTNVRKAGGTLHRLSGMVEKPPLHEAPSDLTIVGGYALSPKVMKDLEKKFKKLSTNATNDALRLSHVFADQIAGGEDVYGWKFPGTRLDCGTLAGFYEAEKFVLENGLTLPER